MESWVIAENFTFPAESNPNIKMRTSWSLLHRTSDNMDVNKEDTERPIAPMKREELNGILFIIIYNLGPILGYTSAILQLN